MIKELSRIYSEELGCEYIVGLHEESFYYLWTEKRVEENEIPQEAIDSPECMHGCIIGTKEFIIDDIENCVGSFRYHGTEEQQEASAEVVETLIEALLQH